MNIQKPAAIRACVSVPVGPSAEPAEFIAFDGLVDSQDHFALRFSGQKLSETPLVRIHSECITGDLFFSRRCDCGFQLVDALQRLRVEGGILIYLRQEGRGIGLAAKLHAYSLQDKGLDTFEANRALGYPEDQRSFTVAAKMLTLMGVTTVRLLTNNPSKVSGLSAAGIDVCQVVPTVHYCTDANRRYLEAKRLKAGHQIPELLSASIPDFKSVLGW